MKRQPKKMSDQVRRAIETCGQSRYAISQQTGIDPATLCRFMQGRHGLSMDTLDLLAGCIGLEVVFKKRATKGSR